jgi:hypothetical protein
MPRSNPRPPNLTEEKLWSWFLSQVDKTDTGCWEWRNGKNKAGYGQIAINRTLVGAHAYALEHALGRPLQKGMLTRHRCNNPPCCNPDHLQEGTPKENMRDRDLAGHTVRGDRHHDVKGENHPHVKLAERDVRIIRALKGWFTNRELSETYGVSSCQICLIQNNKTWKHLK